MTPLLIEACPFGAMQFDNERELAVKCDLYLDRFENDERPACAIVCPTQCIVLGDINTISKKIEARVLRGKKDRE